MRNKHSRIFRTALIAVTTALFSTLVSAGITNSAQALPTTTSWTNAGLQEMVRVSGRISVSTSGSGLGSGSTIAQTGTISVEKPTANAHVVAAFYTAAISDRTTVGGAVDDSDPGITLNGSVIPFSHKAKVFANSWAGWGDIWFVNLFANVTSQVKTTLDAAPSGISTLTVDEGSRFGEIEGTSLVVIFEDSSLPVSSAVIAFGTSNPAGDSFALSFPALTNVSTQKPTLSLGIGYSWQSVNRTQSSTVKIATSSNATPADVSNTAGGQNDGILADGALFTVGGIGDSRSLPNLAPANFAQGEDDELYGLESFMAVGDTSMTFTTRNATGDDNLFQAVLFLEGVEVAGAVTSDTLAADSVAAAPQTQSQGSAGSTSTALAQTGSSYSSGLATVAFGVVGLGLILAFTAKKRLPKKR